MLVMKAFRRRKALSSPDSRFVRTLQSPDQVVYDAKQKCWRASSAAFGPSSKDRSLSGDLEELLVVDGLRADSLYPAVGRAVGASTFTVRQAQALGVAVDHDPVWTNWYHGAARFHGMNTSAIGKAKKNLQNIALDFIAINEPDALRWYRERNEGRYPPGHPQPAVPPDAVSD
jgi:hypothetical protein